MNKLLKNINLVLIPVAVGLCGLASASVYAAEAPIILEPVAPKTAAEKQKVYDYLLDEQGISSIKVGETRTIIIPSDQLFIAGSANFNAKYASNLKIITQLINSYDTTSVAISAFGNQAGDISKALTEKQAQKVLGYLKKNGVDTRLIYGKGYGNSYPVAITGNTQLNQRIEIKFQFYPEEKVY